MPGLIGFTDKHHKYDDTMLLNMRSLLKHFDNYVDDELFSDKTIYASRTHLGLIKQGEQPYSYDNRFFLWLEGEFYNQKELKSKYDTDAITDIELLNKIYISTGAFHFLRDIDGCYAAVLYDKKDNIVYLVTDRYGFKPLYWGIINGDLVWSSELKGFLGHRYFKTIIDRQAVKEFFDFKHLLENRTWFEGIELTPPASILAFNLEKSKLEVTHYWSWSDIKPRKEPADERELVEELGRLFKQSVSRCVNNNERIGILLSGGLDSRAILASVPQDYEPLHTFTFGQRGCDDIKIATKVSNIRGATHHIIELNSNNWLIPRITGVWKSDGMFTLLDMHGIEFYDEYKSYIDIDLNGFWGGVIGGCYLRMSPNHTEEYMARNRGRRFMNQALILGEAWLIHRRPFAGNNFIELVFSLDKKFRQDSYIYHKMLLTAFPEYYNHIPWQKTGCPISYSKRLTKLITFQKRVINILKCGSQRFGFNLKDLTDFTDYTEWTRKEPARSLFEKMLLNKKAIYPEYVDMTEVQSYLRDHLDGKANYDNELCIALTFEIWLQQVLAGKYRDGEETVPKP